MSMCIIRAVCPLDNFFFVLFPFTATEPNGSMAGIHAASEVAFRATAEAVCFARSQDSAERGRL